MNQTVMPVPGTLQAWWIAARPKTLLLSLAPVVLGTAWAVTQGPIDLIGAFLAALGAALLQTAANLYNDLADYRKGADDEKRLGPPRACVSGWIEPRAMAVATVAVLLLAGVVGIALVWRAGWPLFWIGAAGAICAVAYTGGPLPLAYLGVADLFVWAFFGFAAVCGTVWIHLHTVDAGAWLLGAAIGAPATAVLTVNNLRDRDGDARAGKRTIVVRFGVRFARAWYRALIVLPLLLIGVGIATGTLPPGAVAVVVAVPLAVRLWRGIDADGAALNPLLGATAGYTVVVALAASLGMVVSR